MLENVQRLSKDALCKVYQLEKKGNKKDLKLIFFLQIFVMACLRKLSLPSSQILPLSNHLDGSDLHKAKAYILFLSVLLEAIQFISFIKSINKTHFF